MAKKRELIRAERDGKKYVSDSEDTDAVENKHSRVKRQSCVSGSWANQYNLSWNYHEEFCNGKTNIVFRCKFF